MGNALTARLFYSLKTRGIEILFNHADRFGRLQRLGAVASATISTASGELCIKARKGIVLATGG